MLPTVEERKKNRHTFRLHYHDLCELRGAIPLYSVKAHLSRNCLDFYGDRVKVEDWTTILKALRQDRSLRFIAVRSADNSTLLENADTEVRARSCSRRPVLYTRYVMKMLVNSLTGCLAASRVLTNLELEGLPLGLSYVEELAKGISKCTALESLSFHLSSIGDEGVKVICRSVKMLPHILSLDLSVCGVTEKSARSIAGLLQYQKLMLYNDVWKQSLRDQEVQTPASSGVQRLTLNHNTQLGDAGFLQILEEVADHRWFKALDAQNCGLTDVAAGVVLAALKTNTWLSVVDLRVNAVAHTLNKLIMRQLNQNDDNDNNNNNNQYRWLSVDNPQQSTHRLTRSQLESREARSRLRTVRRRPMTTSTSTPPPDRVPGYARPRPGPRVSALEATSGTSLMEQRLLDEPPYLAATPPPSASSSDDANIEESLDLMRKRVEEVQAELRTLSTCYDEEVARRQRAEAEVDRLRRGGAPDAPPLSGVLLNQDTVADIQDAFAAFAEFLRLVRDSGLASQLNDELSSGEGERSQRSPHNNSSWETEKSGENKIDFIPSASSVKSGDDEDREERSKHLGDVEYVQSEAAMSLNLNDEASKVLEYYKGYTRSTMSKLSSSLSVITTA